MNHAEKPLPDMAKSEWVLMEALWARGQASATDLQKDLESQQGWAYSTVKTMLDRLVEKGYVKWRRRGNVYEYSPRVRRKTAVMRVVDDMVDRVLEGTAAPFIQRLVERRGLSADEAHELRAMLDGYAEGEGGPRRGPARDDPSDDAGPPADAKSEP
jgi:BlaI family transcriptional regulator, penicillinase repressor